MGSHGYRGLRRRKGILAPYLVVWGYVGIYRRKKYVGGATWAPRGWRARPPTSCPPGCFLDVRSKSSGSRLFRKSRSRRFHSVRTPFDILFLRYPKNIRGSHETTFSPPQPSVPVRSHLGAFSGDLPEGDSIMEGFYINTIASP